MHILFLIIILIIKNFKLLSHTSQKLNLKHRLGFEMPALTHSIHLFNVQQKMTTCNIPQFTDMHPCIHWLLNLRPRPTSFPIRFSVLKFSILCWASMIQLLRRWNCKNSSKISVENLSLGKMKQSPYFNSEIDRIIIIWLHHQIHSHRFRNNQV